MGDSALEGPGKPPRIQANAAATDGGGMMADERELLRASKAWPVVEAVRLLERVENAPPEKGFVLFQTGYGPSGLPHIGTFAEVFRTSLVRQAFARLSDLPTRRGIAPAAKPDRARLAELYARHGQWPTAAFAALRC
jgi:tRNA synthetases class I (K)